MRSLRFLLLAGRLGVAAGALTLFAGGCGESTATTNDPDQVKQWMTDNEARSKAMEDAGRAAKTQKKTP